MFELGGSMSHLFHPKNEITDSHNVIFPNTLNVDDFIKKEIRKRILSDFLKKDILNKYLTI